MARILVYGINYKPEWTGAGKYTGEMVDWLAQRGHQVEVITAPPYYPTWRIPIGYSAWRYQKEKTKQVTVTRCPTWVPQSPSPLKRLFHLISFTLSTFPVLLWKTLTWKPDMIWLVAPPLLCAPNVVLLGWLTGTKTWLHIQDFELEVAFALDFFAKPVIKPILILEGWLLKQFDNVSTISQKMLQMLVTHKKLPPERCHLFPNWVNCHEIFPIMEENPLRAQLEIAKDTRIVLYSGNMGEKQGLEILLSAAKQLTKTKNLLFLFVGYGSAASRMQTASEDLDNIHWLPLQPPVRFNALLNLADIHVVPQRKDVGDLVLPSKLLGIMASGGCVITTAKPQSQLDLIVGGRGLVVPPGDQQALTEAITELLDNPEKRKSLALKAREYAVEQCHTEAVLSDFEQAAELTDQGIREVA